MNTENCNYSAEFLAADAAVQVAYAKWLDAVLAGDGQDIAKAKAALDAAYAKRDGAK